MSKKLLTIISILALFTKVFSQTILITQAPIGNTTTQVRAPNGLSTYAYLRACELVLASELTGITPSSTLSTFGFTLDPTSVPNINVTGTFTVYLQNTTDVTYSKGTTWSTILSGMTTVYASTMTLPNSVATTSITLTLSTPFVYTGGGIYVAYDWYSAGPYSTSPATYKANSTGLSPGCASANSGTSAPATLGTTAFRPSILFGMANPNANDVACTAIDAPGKVAGMFNTAHTVKGFIKNASNQALNNIPVTLNVTGANTFSNTQIVSTLAAGASTTVTFSAFNPTLPGINTLSLSVPNDDVNTNNSVTYTQSVTCNEWALNPPTATYTSGIGFGTGSGILSVNYSNPASSALTGIRIGISSDAASSGNSVWGVLLSSTGSVIATTNTISLTTGMLGTAQVFTFSTPSNLSAATNYYVGMAQSANTTTGYYPLGSYASTYVPFSNYVTTALTGGTPAPLTSNLGYFDIEAILAAPTTSVNSGAICTGSSFTINPSGANTYSLSSGSAIVTPTSDATYTVVGYGYGGCTSTAISSVTVNSLPTVTVNSGSICAGSSFTIIPGGADTYTISGGLAIVSPTTDATYTVNGIDVNGCQNSAVSSVSVSALPIVTANSGSICAGSSFTITPGGADTYTISGGLAIVSPTADATYTVNGIDVNGCQNSALSSVTVNALPAVMANSGSICAGNSFTITPGGAATYTISGGLAVVSPTADATYTVTGTDGNGCENFAVSSVSVNALPTMTASTTSTLLCSGETSTLSVTGSITSYTWSTGDNTSAIAVTPTTQTTYTVNGTDANDCTNSISITQDVSLCTGITSLIEKDDLIEVYPNPNNGLFTINLNTSSVVHVTNALGELVYSEKMDSGKYDIDLQHYARGIYFVKVIRNDKQYIIKMIKE